MTIPCIQIIYAAHTASCTFLLDSEGICRRIAMAPKGNQRASARSASRCVGAQYVASLDSSAAGGLVEMPRVGAAMLFARVDERGRVSLVRTGIVTSFESQTVDDPFVHSGSVETSAPDLPAKQAANTPARAGRQDQRDPDDYYDPSDRTQRIPAVRREELATAIAALDFEREQGGEFTTAEYTAAPDFADTPPRKPLWQKPQVATLRTSHRDVVDDTDDDDAYATRRSPMSSAPVPSARGMLPRTAIAHGRAAPAPARASDARPAPVPYPSDVQVTRRRRG